MYLAALKAGYHVKGLLSLLIRLCRDSKSYQYLIRVKPRIPAAQVFHLKLLDRLDSLGRYYMALMIHPRKSLKGIKQKRRGSSQEICGLGGYDLAV